MVDLRKLSAVSDAVMMQNVKTILLLQKEIKFANKKADEIEITHFMSKELADKIVRLKRNANALSMTLGLVEDIFMSMRAECVYIYKEVEREAKKAERKRQANLRVAQNKRNYNKKLAIKSRIS